MPPNGTYQLRCIDNFSGCSCNFSKTTVVKLPGDGPAAQGNYNKKNKATASNLKIFKIDEQHGLMASGITRIITSRGPL